MRKNITKIKPDNIIEKQFGDWNAVPKFKKIIVPDSIIETHFWDWSHFYLTTSENFETKCLCNILWNKIENYYVI